MISDKELRQLMAINKRGEAYCPKGDELLLSALEELLQRREAERKAASWDDAPEWAIARRRAKGGWIYYPDMAEVQGMSSLWELQERPK